MTDTPLFGNPDFTPSLNYKERLKALSAKLLASVSRDNYSRASVNRTDTIGAYYVGQEAAIEAAKELVDIWQEAKKYIVFEPAQP